MKRNNFRRTVYYIKIGNDSQEYIDNQDFTYADRTEMNQWEETISNRLAKITVDLSALYQHQGNDLKKLYWIGRISNIKDKILIFLQDRFTADPLML